MLLLALLAPAIGHAQETVGPPDPNAPPPTQGTVGPPQLRTFELPGTKVVPGRPSTTPPTVNLPAIPAPKASTAEPVAPVRTPQAAPAPRIVAPEPATRPVAAAPAPVAEPVPPPTSVPPSISLPIEPQAAQPAIAQPSVATPPIGETEEPAGAGAFAWTFSIAVAAGGGLLAVLLFLLLRSRRQRSAEFAIVDAPAWVPPAPPPEPKPPTPPLARAAPDELLLSPDSQTTPPAKDPPSFLVRSAAAPEPVPEPVPVSASPAPAPSGGVVGIQLRPWLDLEFRPERATTTPEEASVQFELAIINNGNTVATKVRIEAGMFNAGPQLEAEVAQFFAGQIVPVASGMIQDSPARSAATLRNVVAMPRNLVHEIEINGRRLFIPTVAFNVHYEWGSGKKGRTSVSFLVGREAETPSSKMGPFRLDQGPRIYRQVGQRPSQPAELV
jgi:hypothetical protein